MDLFSHTTAGSGFSHQRKFLKRVMRPIRKLNPFRKNGLRYGVLRDDSYPSEKIASTNLLLEYLEFVNLKGKKVLETGHCAGFIGLYAALEGGQVSIGNGKHFCQVSMKKRFDAVAMPIQRAGGTVRLLEDLFPATGGAFEVVLIHPRERQSGTDCAGYYRSLFSGLRPQLAADPEIALVMSDECSFKDAEEAARAAGFRMEGVLSKDSMLDAHYLYRVYPL